LSIQTQTGPPVFSLKVKVPPRGWVHLTLLQETTPEEPWTVMQQIDAPKRLKVGTSWWFHNEINPLLFTTKMLILFFGRWSPYYNTSQNKENPVLVKRFRVSGLLVGGFNPARQIWNLPQFLGWKLNIFALPPPKESIINHFQKKRWKPTDVREIKDLFAASLDSHQSNLTAVIHHANLLANRHAIREKKQN